MKSFSQLLNVSAAAAASQLKIGRLNMNRIFNFSASNSDNGDARNCSCVRKSDWMSAVGSRVSTKKCVKGCSKMSRSPSASSAPAKRGLVSQKYPILAVRFTGLITAHSTQRKCSAGMSRGRTRSVVRRNISTSGQS